MDRIRLDDVLYKQTSVQSPPKQQVESRHQHQASMSSMTAMHQHPQFCKCYTDPAILAHGAVCVPAGLNAYHNHHQQQHHSQHHHQHPHSASAGQRAPAAAAYILKAAPDQLR